MSSPRRLRLWLVRHAVSAANLDKKVNAVLPDVEVPLAPAGQAQAEAAGEWLAAALSGRSLDPAITRALGRNPALQGRTRVLCSPYTRTRQTANEIMKQLARAGVQHDYREDIALREISFGLFDGYPDDELESVFPLEYAHYKKHLATPGSEFWAPMPLGESRAQVADRVKGVFGTILRDASPERSRPVENVIVVSHGVTLRALVMQWMHHPYEWYGQQTNPGNASIQLIAAQPREASKRYFHAHVWPGYAKSGDLQELREEGVIT